MGAASVADAGVTFALDMLMRLQESGADPAVEAELQAWAAADPANQADLQRARRAFAAVQALRSHKVPAPVLHDTLVGSRVRAQRRAVLRGALGLGVMTAGSWGAWRAASEAGMLADARTGTAQRSELAWADGHHLWLDAGSAGDVSLRGGQRDIRLYRGRVLAQLTGSSLPLAVRHGRQEAVAQGAARFSMNAHGKGLVVSAIEGRVSVRSPGAAAVELDAGSSAVLTASDQWQVGPSSRSEAPLWLRGMVALEDEPLRALTDVLTAYRSGWVHVDEDAARVRISGVFSLDDTDRTLRALVETQPLRVSALGGVWTRISRA
jgi:transmembrane sensor